jgi:hypothetical protein
MRRFVSILTATVGLFLYVLSARPQASNSAPEQTPKALTTLYNHAMQAKERLRAITAAQQPATVSSNIVQPEVAGL